MKPTPDKPELSKCHKAPVHIGGDDREGTHYYVCNECNDICGLHVDKPDTSYEGLREEIIEIIGLEHNLHDQLVPANMDDFLSDWTSTIDTLMNLYQRHMEAVINQVIGEDESMSPGNFRNFVQVGNRNELRAEQRQRLADMVGGSKI